MLEPQPLSVTDLDIAITPKPEHKLRVKPSMVINEMHSTTFLLDTDAGVNFINISMIKASLKSRSKRKNMKTFRNEPSIHEIRPTSFSLSPRRRLMYTRVVRYHAIPSCEKSSRYTLHRSLYSGNVSTERKVVPSHLPPVTILARIHKRRWI